MQKWLYICWVKTKFELFFLFKAYNKNTAPWSTNLLLWVLVLSTSTLSKVKFMSEDQSSGQDGELGPANSDP